jgi:hypothetical protein
MCYVKTDSVNYFKCLAELFHVILIFGYRAGGTLLVAQLVEAVRYKAEGRGFDSKLCHWNFSFT